MIPPLSNTYSDIKESECEVKQNELKNLNERDRKKEAQWGDTESGSTRTHARGEAEGL